MNSQASPPPDRTTQQRLDALASANKKRGHRGRVKRDLKARRVGLFTVIDDPVFDTAKVFDIIVCLPRYGRVRALKLFVELDISPAKTCAHITPRQRRALAEALGPLTQRWQA